MRLEDITPVILTFNEAPNLAHCLEKLSWAREVIVLDERSYADIEADNITTDEGPFFRIIDIEHPGQLSVETRPILGNVARTRISAAFTVPAGTQAVEVQLLRRSSLRFDNKIAGRVHIHSISLAPFAGSQETVGRL